MEVYKVDHLSFGYHPYDEITGERKEPAIEILHDISFSVEEGSFVILCGATGCGKSTLLRLLKKQLQPKGEISGEILFYSRFFDEYEPQETAARIGFVMQNPNDQYVTDKVWHEVAFGLENLGIPSGEIRRRVAEIAAYFGIDEWFEKKIDELSGGQKQLLNLASVLVMNPRVLILDEPTAQLDPIAAQNFLHVLKRLHQELGITILLAEHRLEDTLSMADRVLVMEQGRIVADTTPRRAALEISEKSAIYQAFPEASRLFRELAKDFQSESMELEEDINGCPITIGEGRTYLKRLFGDCVQGADEQSVIVAHGAKTHEAETVLELRDVWFRYDRKGTDILRGTSMKVRRGEFLCLLGSNGSGKTTVLKLIAGILKAQEGKLLISKEIKGKVMCETGIAYLPQDVETLFVADTVERELGLVGNLLQPEDTAFFERRKDCHPYDLSGGEKQILGMAKVLAGNKKLLLLDEPTKGLDASAKEQIRKRLLQEQERGTTIIMVTHDLEFASRCANRCGMFFRGNLVSLEETRHFFTENRFYTTAARRIAGGYYTDVITGGELYEKCRQQREGK